MTARRGGCKEEIARLTATAEAEELAAARELTTADTAALHEAVERAKAKLRLLPGIQRDRDRVVAERKSALRQVLIDHAVPLMAQLDLESPADLERRAAREEQRRRLDAEDAADIAVRRRRWL